MNTAHSYLIYSKLWLVLVASEMFDVSAKALPLILFVFQKFSCTCVGTEDNCVIC